MTGFCGTLFSVFPPFDGVGGKGLITFSLVVPLSFPVFVCGSGNGLITFSLVIPLSFPVFVCGSGNGLITFSVLLSASFPPLIEGGKGLMTPASLSPALSSSGRKGRVMGLI